MKAIIEAAGSQHPPLHLFPGSDAYALAKQKMETMDKELENWKTLTVSTDF